MIADFHVRVSQGSGQVLSSKLHVRLHMKHVPKVSKRTIYAFWLSSLFFKVISAQKSGPWLLADLTDGASVHPCESALADTKRCFLWHLPRGGKLVFPHVLHTLPFICLLGTDKMGLTIWVIVNLKRLSRVWEAACSSKRKLFLMVSNLS